MINKISTKSRIAEVGNVTQRIISAYNNSSLSSDTHLSDIITELSPLYNSLTIATKFEKAESELEDLDAICDDGIRSFYYLTQGLSHFPLEQKKKCCTSNIKGIW